MIDQKLDEGAKHYQDIRKLFDNYIITEENLKVMTIYNLRALAFGAKIQAAVTMKKEVVIDALLEFGKGNTAVYVPSTKKGKPPEMGSNFYPAIERLKEKNQLIAIKKVNANDILSDSVGGFTNDIFQETKDGESIIEGGILEIMPDDFGYLRGGNYGSKYSEIYVSSNIINNIFLRNGDYVKGEVIKNANKKDCLKNVIEVNGKPVTDCYNRMNFKDLVAVFPKEKFQLTNEENNEMELRLIDLFCPIGKGQRGIIATPLKTDATTILKSVSKAMIKNNSNVKVLMLLIGQRPEEVTDIKESVEAEVFFTTFDDVCEEQIAVAETVLSHGKRLVESGYDVVIMIDSITKLVRAYNNVSYSSSRTMNGELEVNALEVPKKFFGSARNIKNQGSFTILATAEVETGNRMDDMIYDEFIASGNMELRLDRTLAENRISPSINCEKSYTMKDDLLLTKEQLDVQYSIRKTFTSQTILDDTISLIDMVGNTKTNHEFIEKYPSLVKIKSNNN